MFSVVYQEFKTKFPDSTEEMSAKLVRECTAKYAVDWTYPTKLGNIVQERAFVRIGVLFLSACAKLGKETKKGPK